MNKVLEPVPDFYLIGLKSVKVLLDGAGGAYTSTLQQYQAKADYFTCACLQKNDGYNVPMTPG